MATCPSCGKDYEGTPTFCPHCFAPLSTSEGAQVRAPASKKSHRTRNVIIVAATAIVVLIVIAAALAGSGTSGVTITAASLSYSGQSCGFPSSQAINLTSAANGQLRLSTNENFNVSATLTASAPSSNCVIQSFVVNTPGFALVSVSPTLPHPLSAGSSVQVTITVTAPNAGFTGTLSIGVITD